MRAEAELGSEQIERNPQHQFGSAAGPLPLGFYDLQALAHATNIKRDIPAVRWQPARQDIELLARLGRCVTHFSNMVVAALAASTGAFSVVGHGQTWAQKSTIDHPLQTIGSCEMVRQQESRFTPALIG
jgi:hypothetical protein